MMSTHLDTLLQGQATSVDIPPAPPAAAALLAHPGPQAGGIPMEAVPQMALVGTHPGTRAGNTATASTAANMEESRQHAVEQRVSAAPHTALAITNDETDGEEEPRSHTSKGATGSSGKLRSANTSAKHTVIWPHEYVYTPEGQPTDYESMSSLAFVEGYMTIMDMQPKCARKHMWVHLRDLMQDAQCFGWSSVRTFHGVWLQHIEQGRATWGDEVTHLEVH